MDIINNTCDIVVVALYNENTTPHYFENLRKNYPNPVKVITRKDNISSFESLNLDGVVIIDEDTIVPGCTGKEFKTKFDTINADLIEPRWNWYWQQFIKLHIYLHKNISDKYVVMDIDFFLLQKIPFFKGDKICFNTSAFELYEAGRSWKEAYYKLNTALLDFSDKEQSSMHVSEYMPFDKELVKQMFSDIEKYSKKTFVDVFWNMLPSGEILLSEYTLFSMYVKHHHPEKYTAIEIKYFRSGSSFYEIAAVKYALPVFKKIWKCDAVCFEPSPNSKECLRKENSKVAKLRYKFNFYPRLLWTIPTFENIDTYYSKKYYSYIEKMDHRIKRKKAKLLLVLLNIIISDRSK